MASKPVTRDSSASLLPVVGIGLIVAITLLVAIALGVLAVLLVG